MEVICCFHGGWSYFHVSWPTPTKLQVDLPPWKLVETSMEEVDGSRWQ